jgi:hypothetical protein
LITAVCRPIISEHTPTFRSPDSYGRNGASLGSVFADGCFAYVVKLDDFDGCFWEVGGDFWFRAGI